MPSAADAENRDELHGPADQPLSVVGIGASAGGLTALKTFFSAVDIHDSVAYVVVVHLSPDHESHLADLLQPHARLPVRQVTETTALEAGNVYVIPPGANLAAIDTHLRLSDLEPRRERAPIDHFFRTLAEMHDGDAVGVILTGTGSDGTIGLREIKEKGGLTIVQDPADAEYDGMPQSALATGVVDVVLPVAEIPEAINGFVGTRPRMRVPEDGEEIDDQERLALQQIFAQLRARTGRDFTRYKRTTILRRIARRMQLLRCEELPEYVDLLRQDPDESRVLADDLLITVTSFFRDPEVFGSLEETVVPSIMADKGSSDTVRVWSVGCATGEEAYSLAILFLEAAGRMETPPRIQIFASDLHERSLATARDGFYAGDIRTDVSPERLERFFTKDDGGYRVSREVRELVVFSPHNLLGDPPFSHLDLVTCRNLLIYLERSVQSEVVELFHYALRPESWLMLGTSETVESAELFELVHKRHCLYRRKSVPAPEPRLPVFPLPHRHLAKQGSSGGGEASEPLAYGNLHQRIVERFGPPSILVSADDRVVHLSERAGRYLVHPGGEVTTSVFKLVREELRLDLRSAIHLARRQEGPAETEARQLRLDGEVRSVSALVQPATEPDDSGYLLVLFREHPPGYRPRSTEQALQQPDEDAATGRAAELAAELELNRHRHQALVEEYETSQEELRASNEELQSSNEELRSTLEELETSKEELQSMNEELHAVNQENRHKVEELSQLSADLQNLLSATGIATLFLDRQLRILRFTPRVGELFNVRPADRGRPISDITHSLGYEELVADGEQVLQQLVPVQREIRDRDGRWYLTRVLPYRNHDDRIDGVVITFVDITDRKHAEEDVRAAKTYAESIVDTLHEPLLVLTPELRVQSANDAFLDLFEVTEEATIGRLVYDLGNGQWQIPELRRLLEEVLPEETVFEDYEVAHRFESLGERVMLLNGRQLDSVQLILLGIRDVTGAKAAEAQLHRLKETLEQQVEERTRQVQNLSETLSIAEQQERSRLSHLLHDDLQQLLYGVQMKVALAREHTDRGASREALEQLDRSNELIEDAILRTRQLTVDLNPPILDGEGLVDSIEWLRTHMRDLHMLEVDIDAPSQLALEDVDARILLFQVVRELLFNVAKHANVDRATVEVVEEGGRIRITVADQGRGFEPGKLTYSAGRRGGLGLSKARERLRRRGGDLQVESAAGEGARVVVYGPSDISES